MSGVLYLLMVVIVLVSGCTSPRTVKSASQMSEVVKTGSLDIYRACLLDILKTYGGANAAIYLAAATPEEAEVKVVLNGMDRVWFTDSRRVRERYGAYYDTATGKPVVILTVRRTDDSNDIAEVRVKANVSGTGGEERIFTFRRDSRDQWRLIHKRTGGIS